MYRTPVNPEAHRLLTDQGAAVLEAQGESKFIGESNLIDYPEYDVYQSDGMDIVIDCLGMVACDTDLAARLERELSREPLMYLKECYDNMLNDQGLSIEDGDFDRDIAKIKWTDGVAPAPVLLVVEAELAKLSKEERETLAIGDQEDWPPIFEKLGERAEVVHLVLDAMFETIGM